MTAEPTTISELLDGLPPVNRAELIEDLSIEDYHARKDVISKSMLADMDCPARFKWKYLDGGKEPDSDCLNIGNAVHTLALEPKLFHERFYVIGEGIRRDKRTEAFKEVISEAGTRKLIAHNDFKDIQGMAASLAGNKWALALLQGSGKIEPSIFWTDEETGIPLRCRPDFMRDDGLIVDLKTGHTAEPEGFMRTAWNLGYDMSAAMTSEGYRALTGKMPDNYVFLVVEKEPPYIIEAYDSFRPCDPADPAHLTYHDAGAFRFRQALNQYKQCRDTNNWPAYSGKISPMKVPYYGLKQMEGTENV
jgi:hypothetical protein